MRWAAIGQKPRFSVLEPTSDLAAVLRELTPEKPGKGPLLRSDLEAVHVHHEAQHAEECRRPGEED
ncbi:hypothetical protein D3C71_2002670 [compost metagenome]